VELGLEPEVVTTPTATPSTTLAGSMQ
jgi:hypothetical protein